MGTFSHAIEIARAPGGPFIALDAMVDTGSLYTWIPEGVLRRLEVLPTGRRAFIMADGTRIQRDVAWIELRLDDQQAPTLCVFGDEGSLLLGAFTLEGFALAADPVNKRLIPMDVIPALTLRSGR